MVCIKFNLEYVTNYEDSARDVRRRHGLTVCSSFGGERRDVVRWRPVLQQLIAPEAQHLFTFQPSSCTLATTIRPVAMREAEPEVSGAERYPPYPEPFVCKSAPPIGGHAKPVRVNTDIVIPNMTPFFLAFWLMHVRVVGKRH